MALRKAESILKQTFSSPSSPDNSQLQHLHLQVLSTSSWRGPLTGRKPSRTSEIPQTTPKFPPSPLGPQNPHSSPRYFTILLITPHCNDTLIIQFPTQEGLGIRDWTLETDGPKSLCVWVCVGGKVQGTGGL